MKLNKTIVVAALVLVGTVHALGQEQKPMRGPGGPGGPGMMKVMEELKLTEDQMKDVQKLHTDLAKQEVAQGAKTATARIELQELLRADNPDKAAIEKKVNEIAQLGVQSHMQRLNQWFAVNKLLNADQQKTWKHVLQMAGARQNMGHGPMMMNRGMMGRGMMNRGMMRMHRPMDHEEGMEK